MGPLSHLIRSDAEPHRGEGSGGAIRLGPCLGLLQARIFADVGSNPRPRQNDPQDTHRLILTHFSVSVLQMQGSGALTPAKIAWLAF